MPPNASPNMTDPVSPSGGILQPTVRLYCQMVYNKIEIHTTVQCAESDRTNSNDFYYRGGR